MATIQVGNGPDAIASGYGSVWVANLTDDTLSRIDQGSGRIVATIALGSAPAGLAAGGRGIWVTSAETGRLLLVDPRTSRVSRAVPVGGSPGGVAVGAGSVWVADSGGVVARVDQVTGRVRKIMAGGSPAGVAYADGAVWVADSLSGSVARIDPWTGSMQLIHVGNEPTALVAAGPDMLTTVLPSLASHRGGTLTLVAQVTPHDLAGDPAIAWNTYDWDILSMTNDGLAGYRRVGGPAGNTIVPDLATALPVQADGGKTYTFRLRSGIRFSSGALVRPEDFRRALERVFVINHGSGPAAFYSGLVGARQCERIPRHCDLAQGIVTSSQANTVTFHLTAPDPEFLYKLALPFADAVPATTPDHTVGPAQLPATGPYMTQSLVPGRSWILVRNPLFRQWSSQAQPGGYPDRIVLRLGVRPAAAVKAVEHGSADVLLTPPSASRIHELATRYAGQLHTGPVAATFALFVNTRVWPFSSLAARRALNYAIDRNTMIGLTGGPLGPGVPVQATGRYLVSVLRQLAYRASLRVIGPNTYYQRAGDSRMHVQIGEFTWYQDFPAPSDFIDPLFTCRSFLPDNPANVNDSAFCNRRIDAQTTLALALEAANPDAAANLWARIDHEIVGQAPWVPLYNPRALVLVSVRVGNYQFDPFWTVLIDQLWVR